MIVNIRTLKESENIQKCWARR